MRDNVRIVLTFSPVGASFRTRCRMFPALVNCCTVDWYDPWPEDALLQVSTRLLGEARNDLGVDEAMGPLRGLKAETTLSARKVTVAEAEIRTPVIRSGGYKGWIES